MIKASFFGLGRVGLCAAACFAGKGFNVIGVDIDREKIKGIMKGEVPFHEPGLIPLLKRVIENNLFTCTDDYEYAVKNTDVSFITVGTPIRTDGNIDLRHVESAAKGIGEALKATDRYRLIVVRSTVTPGTSEKIVKPILERRSGKTCGVDFGLCVNPEFLREGTAIRDFKHSDRIILGEYDEKSGVVLEALYRGFYGSKCPPVIRTSLSTAEFIKCANNAFLATKISFINTMANICEKIPSVDITIVAQALGLDKRIAPSFLNAGLGYGGSCLPKDVKTLIAFSKDLEYTPELLRAVDYVNNSQPYKAVELAKSLVSDLRGKRVAILGLAFKPNTDDMREAVSTKVIDKLLHDGAEVIVYDPAAMDNAKKMYGSRIKYASSTFQCIENADCCIVVTEWEDFKHLKPEDFVKNMKTPNVVDGRRIYDPKGFSHRAMFKAIGLGADASLHRL